MSAEVSSSKGDGAAYTQLSKVYNEGNYGIGKDEMRALHYSILGAAELGSTDACSVIGSCFIHGRGGVQVDKVKAGLFYKVCAFRGCIVGRHAIGHLEYNEFGNHEVGIRHWKIAATAGMQPSIKRLRDIYNADGKKPGKEFIGKDELDSIYRMGHEAQQDIKSEEREKHMEGEDLCKC
jgi:hypothetical protein